MQTVFMQQDERHQLVTRALWFAAERYIADKDGLYVLIHAEEAAHCIIGILDDLNMLTPLPPG